MNDEALRDAAQRLPKTIEPPRDLWPGIAARLGETARRPRPARWPWLGLAAAAALALWVVAPGGDREPAWPVERLAGRPTVADAPLTGAGAIRVGEWIETDDSSRALVTIGRIGHVEVKPGTRVRLTRARPDDHRLALARGALYAKVDTVPRLFYVETPAGTAIDLGCAYTLETDSAGNGRLHVVGGIVEFQSGERWARVPVGAIVLIEAGVGPGIPFVDDAPEALRRALSKLDVPAALAAARPADAVSLWHLLHRVGAPARGAVYHRLAALVPPPAGVTREAIVAQDAAALEAYWKAIYRIQFRRMILRGVREIDPRTGLAVP